jgi:hypothetical protein
MAAAPPVAAMTKVLNVEPESGKEGVNARMRRGLGLLVVLSDGGWIGYDG